MPSPTMIFPTERVEQLEAELKQVRSAFEDYIESSKELEEGLDKELTCLHKKLAGSSQANELLGTQLENMEPMLSELEVSLQISKGKLKEESRLRRQAEIAQVEMEARFEDSETNMTALRDENECLREECGALHEELEFKCREFEDVQNGDVKNRKQLQELGSRLEARIQKREGSSGETSDHTESANNGEQTQTGESATQQGADSTVDDSYAEVLDELEGVTEQLIATQQKLWKTEDRLRESESRVRSLSSSDEHLERKTDGNAMNSLIDLSADEDTSTSDVDGTVNRSQWKLADELIRVKEQLEAAQRELRAIENNGVGGLRIQRQTDIDNFKQQIDSLKDAAENAGHQLEKYQQELEESHDENATLVEEIACLREVLQDHSNNDIDEEQRTSEIRSTIFAEAEKQREQDLAESSRIREKEINALREKLKTIVKENASLRDAVDRLEIGVPTTFVRKEEVALLKKEISKLKETVESERQEKESTVQQAESFWRRKMEDARSLFESQTRGDMAEEQSMAMLSIQDQMEVLADDKFALEHKVEDLEKEVRCCRKENSKFVEQAIAAANNLKTVRDEILAFKKKTGVLSADLQHTKRTLGKVEADAQRVRQHHADACAELEVARQVLDEAGLEEETIAREDETEMKRQIHALSKNLEHTRQEYADLENDYLDSQHRFCDSQTEASRKTEDEIEYLNRKIGEMEEVLEHARADHSEMSVQLEQTRRECHEVLKKGERQKLREIEDQCDDATEQNALLEEKLDDTEIVSNEMKELSAQLDELEEELDRCKEELESTRLENSKLKSDMKKPSLSGIEGIKVLDKFFAVSRSSAPDPEQVEEGEGVEVIRASSPDALDPPTMRSELLGKGLQALESDQSGMIQLRSQLLDVTLENEYLKDKLLSTDSKNDENQGLSSSSSATGAEIMEQIKTLQVALIHTEKTSEKLEEISQRLTVSEVKLAASEEALTHSKDENGSLKAEILALKDTVSEARKNLESAKADIELSKVLNSSPVKETGNGFNHLRDQLKNLTHEKAALQHQLDDSKIALSVSQYAQERNKEELRGSETKLSCSVDDVFKLKHELNSKSRSLAELKEAFDDVMSELERKRSSNDGDSRKAVTTLSKQIKQLSEENNGLQQMVSELEEALDLSQREIDNKSRQVNSLHDTLVSTQEETRLLTDEISHLTHAFETAKLEYNTVVDELEAVNELFDEARDEAEKSGKEAAMDEIRGELLATREEERRMMKEQVRKVFEENAALQRQVEDIESSLTEARNAHKTSHEIDGIKREVQILKEALRASAEEVKTLREKEFSLNLVVKDCKSELKQAKHDLAITTTSLEDPRRMPTKESKVREFRTIEESEEHKALRGHLKKLIDETEHDVQGSESTESHSMHKAEGLRLKVELLDMSMSLQKIMQENSVIEEELERVKDAFDEARQDGERHGKLKASKEIRREMKQERDSEMKEFKKKFNELMNENSVLSEKLRDAAVQLSRTTDYKEQGSEELSRMKNQLKAAKVETGKFQQEVFNLTVELETANEDHDQVVEELRSSIKAERSSKVKSLQNKLTDLSVENTTLQQRLRSAETVLSTTQSSEGRTREGMEHLVESLRESQALIRGLENEVHQLKGDLRAIKSSKDALLSNKTTLEAKLKETESSLDLARSATEQDLAKLNQALRSSKEENSKLKAQASQLKQILESSTKELDQLREQFDRVCTEVSARDNSEANLLRTQLKNLAEEKAALQQQADDARITLSLQKYSQDRNVEELKVYQERLQSTKDESNNQDLSKIYSELTKAKEEFRETMDVMRQINKILDTVEGVSTVTSTMDSNTTHRAEDIKAKVAEMTAMLLKTKKEHSSLRDEMKAVSMENKLVEKRFASGEAAMGKVRHTQLKDKMELELCELKYAETKKEASGYQNDATRLRTALEYAQRDHTSLRQQLEHMNLRVAQMCMEAEARGKAAASHKLGTDKSNINESDQRELLGQFKRFYEENLSLQEKLDEMGTALAESRDTEGKHKAAMEKIKREAKESKEKAGKLESLNKRLTEELGSLRGDLNKAKENRTAVVRELGLVKERLMEMAAIKATETKNSTSDSITLSSNRDAEIRLLQDQFRKLSKQSVSLGQMVEDAESAVASMRAKQERTREESQSRKTQANQLQLQVEKAVDDSGKRDQEIGELSGAMDNRVSTAEENVNRLERGISVAKGKLQVTEAGLHVLQKRGRRYKPAQLAPAVQRDSGNVDEDSSLHSAEEQTHSESREDSNAQSSKTPREAAPPQPRQATTKETSLTSRALQAIAHSKKKNTLRKFDIRAAQSKILGVKRLFPKKAIEPATDSPQAQAQVPSGRE